MPADIALPISIPAGSVILSVSPLRWREPDRTECELKRVYWANDGWHVQIQAVRITPNCTLGVAGND